VNCNADTRCYGCIAVLLCYGVAVLLDEARIGHTTCILFR
jgi:hypothetical protein